MRSAIIELIAVSVCCASFYVNKRVLKMLYKEEDSMAYMMSWLILSSPPCTLLVLSIICSLSHII